MAEATLNDVIGRLRVNNERQVNEQSNTTDAVNTLSGMMRGFLDYLELEALKQKERDAEARKKRTAPAPSSSSTSSGGGRGFGFYLPPALAGLAGTLAGISGFAAGLVAATEGLGPSLKNIKSFFSAINKAFSFPARALDELSRGAFGGKTFSQYITKQVTRLSDFFKRFEFDPKSTRFRDITTGRFAVKPGALYRTIQPIIKFFDSVGETIKSIRLPDALVKRIDNFTAMFKEGGRFAGIGPALANNRFITAFIRVLKPIAVILSTFDGLGNARREMEDREGFFNKYVGGGLGGFMSGALGSFFGEFANIFLDAPMYIIKKMLPEWMLIENADGSVSINKEAGMFGRFLGGIDTFDFNKLITDLIQTPFDQLGLAFDFLTDIMTGEGDSRKTLTEYFNEKSFFGVATDVAGWAFNTVFSPLNALLREVERSFSTSEIADEDTLTQRISRWVGDLGGLVLGILPSKEELKEAFPATTELLTSLGEWVSGLYEQIMSIIPSWEDIKLSIADVLPDNRLGDFARDRLGIVESATPAADKLGASLDELGSIAKNITNLESGVANLGDQDQNATRILKEQIADEQRALASAKAETEALLAQASQNPAANQQVVQNYQQQFETIMFPNSGSLDDNDSPRR